MEKKLSTYKIFGYLIILFVFITVFILTSALSSPVFAGICWAITFVIIVLIYIGIKLINTNVNMIKCEYCNHKLKG